MPPLNSGVLQVDYVTVDVAALTDAGSEPVSTWQSESTIDRLEGAAVVGQESGDYDFAYDHVNDAVHARAVADGTDVAAGTDVGEVRLRLEGRL